MAGERGQWWLVEVEKGKEEERRRKRHVKTTCSSGRTGRTKAKRGGGLGSQVVVVVAYLGGLDCGCSRGSECSVFTQVERKAQNCQLGFDGPNFEQALFPFWPLSLILRHHHLTALPPPLSSCLVGPSRSFVTHIPFHNSLLSLPLFSSLLLFQLPLSPSLYSAHDSTDQGFRERKRMAAEPSFLPSPSLLPL